MKEYIMTSIAPTICELMNVRAPAQSEGIIIEEIIKDMGHQKRLAVVALDAFGAATWRRFRELTINFNLLADQKLLHVRSVLPAKTPVNFATMMTGASSDAHKIRDRAEPLNVETVFHVIAETCPGAESLNCMKSAAVGRASSTVGILLSKFADYRCIAASNTDEELFQLAIKAIQEKIPEFILVQFLDIDDAGHKYGIESNKMETAVSDTDNRLGRLFPYFAERDYGLMVLADHGAHQTGRTANHDGSTDDDMIIPLTWGYMSNKK